MRHAKAVQNDIGLHGCGYIDPRAVVRGVVPADTFVPVGMGGDYEVALSERRKGAACAYANEAFGSADDVFLYETSRHGGAYWNVDAGNLSAFVLEAVDGTWNTAAEC